MEKLSLHRSPMLACGLALLIAAGGMLLSTSGAQAAAHRGAVLVKDINPGRNASITAIYSNCGCHYNGGQLTDATSAPTTASAASSSGEATARRGARGW